MKPDTNPKYRPEGQRRFVFWIVLLTMVALVATKLYYLLKR